MSPGPSALGIVGGRPIHRAGITQPPAPNFRVHGRIRPSSSPTIAENFRTCRPGIVRFWPPRTRQYLKKPPSLLFPDSFLISPPHSVGDTQDHVAGCQSTFLCDQRAGDGSRRPTSGRWAWRTPGRAFNRSRRWTSQGGPAHVWSPSREAEGGYWASLRSVTGATLARFA